LRDVPGLRKLEQHVASIRRRGFKGERSGVPAGMRIGEVKSAAAWQAKFQGAERLVTVISEPIYRVNLNKRLRSGDKLNANFLFFDGVAWAQGRRAASSARPHRRQ
jgi:hypothetical protein